MPGNTKNFIVSCHGASYGSSRHAARYTIPGGMTVYMFCDSGTVLHYEQDGSNINTPSSDAYYLLNQLLVVGNESAAQKQSKKGVGWVKTAGTTTVDYAAYGTDDWSLSGILEVGSGSRYRIVSGEPVFELAAGKKMVKTHTQMTNGMNLSEICALAKKRGANAVYWLCCQERIAS